MSPKSNPGHAGSENGQELGRVATPGENRNLPATGQAEEAIARCAGSDQVLALSSEAQGESAIVLSSPIDLQDPAISLYQHLC